MSGSVVTPMAWLFIRGSDSVRVEASVDVAGFRLAICGPGKDRQTLHVRDAQALANRQSEIEGRLVAAGFSLNPSTERRRYPR